MSEPQTVGTAATASPSNHVMQSLWVGGRLSTLERLCITSFLQNGHAFRLYAYGDVGAVPPGTEVVDARTILPEERIFTHKREGIGHGGFAGFADLFRLTLLHKVGGWWVDMDMVCLKPFDFPQAEIVATSFEGEWGEPAINCAMKFRAGSSFLEFCLRAFAELDLSNVEFAETGPFLIQRAIRELHAESLLLPHEVFCPIPWRFARFIAAPRRRILWYNFRRRVQGGERIPSIPRGSYALHLWTQIWKQEKLDKDGTYPPGSIYEQLKRRYGVRSMPAAGTA